VVSNLVRDHLLDWEGAFDRKAKEKGIFFDPTCDFLDSLEEEKQKSF